ncbi:unnamed protein product [Durusdinium trenchii]|uniref:Uncharacterized protein n=1 Tax=Durusdinium trenchii TaxID=1381693 RepID=A0ABP0I4S9_9DINO
MGTEEFMVIGSLLSCAVLVHLYLTKTDWGDLRAWISSVMHPSPRDVAKETRVEEEMVKLRQSNYISFSRYSTHLEFGVGCFFLWEAFATSGFETIMLLIACCLSYLQHLMVAKDLIQLTPQRIKIVNYWLHSVSTLGAVLPARAGSSFKFGLWQSFLTAMRFCLVLCCLDPQISIPFQVLYTAVGMLTYFFAFDESRTELGPLFYTQVFVLIQTIAFSIIIDMALRGRIYAKLDTADAESLVSSFRRVLRGACDGEVLLDSQMNVAQESECLKHLILTDVSLKGRSFENLLADGERPRFREFIEASTNAFGAELSAPPFCSRVSFRGSAGIGVAADVYHVPVPGLFGANEPYHLVAFKEDPESRPHPEASADAVPAELLHTTGVQEPLQHATHSRTSGGTSASQTSESSGRSSCAHMCPELREMTLLLDVETEFQDVQQAHLNFERKDEAESDLAHARGRGQGSGSSMPSLRSLVKPTDWEKLRSLVRNFVELALMDPNLEQKLIHKMTVKLPGQCGWLKVNEATLHRISGASGLVWLLLKGFRPETLRGRAPSLEGISEGVRQRSVAVGRARSAR